jgi:hypothetical protein
MGFSVASVTAASLISDSPAFVPYVGEHLQRKVASGTIGQERLATDLVDVVRAWLYTFKDSTPATARRGSASDVG